jgi:excisionase family DNA binding protein/PAS domain S-box-containing protein
MEKRGNLPLTVKEVASYLKVNQTTIYRLLRRSEIPAFKVGGDWRFNLESVDAWRRRQTKIVARRRTDNAVPLPDLAEAPDVLARLYRAISSLVAPPGELQAMLPLIKRIAQAIDERRDASEYIGQLYHGREIPVRAENLFEFAPIAFAVVDRHCRVVSFNEGYCRLMEISPKRLRSIALTELVCETDRDRAVEALRQLLKGEARSNSFAGSLTAEGAPIMVRSQAWAVRRSRAAQAEYAASILERAATRDEAAETFARCAEDLSKRREKILSRG